MATERSLGVADGGRATAVERAKLRQVIGREDATCPMTEHEPAPIFCFAPFRGVLRPSAGGMMMNAEMHDTRILVIRAAA